MVRGDVVLCDLNPIFGTEQAGVRPVVIVQITAPTPSVLIRSLPHLLQGFDEPFCLLMCLSLQVSAV